MIIEKNFSKYLVFSDDTVNITLNKINDNKARICFVVLEDGQLVGVVTDGDIRRWLTKTEILDLNQPIAIVMNKKFVAANVNDANAKISSLFSKKIQALPIIDDKGKLISIAFPQLLQCNFDGTIVNEESPAFIIAEIGNNHNGDIATAKKLVDLACEAGADCVKFQMRDMGSLYATKYLSDVKALDLGTQYTLDLLSKFQLSDEELFEVFDYCKSKRIIPLCTAWDKVSLQKLEEYGISGYKMSSADFINYDLMDAIIATRKPMICSTGMVTDLEIEKGIKHLQEAGAQFILLHCNSTYPAPFKDINLQYIQRLKYLSNTLVGYSGHERDIYVSIAAVAMGAKVIEKHFSLDRDMEGNDHKVSLLPEEFKEMVKGIRQVEESLGNSNLRIITQGELMNRETLSKSLVAVCDIKPGTIITEGMVQIKGPGQGMAPYRIKEVIGRSLKIEKIAGECFFETDIGIGGTQPRNYDFHLDWGIPVRYHDFEKLKELTNLKIIEIHLSYKDLDLNFRDFISEKSNLGLVIHAPELFSGDHTLDLCSEDETYRKRSIKEMQRVIDLTNDLKQYFQTNRPCIVVNVGGFSKEKFHSSEKREQLYKILEKSIAELNTEGVELIPQTMPPFPWHFGGQQYHNLFLNAAEIVSFCQRNNMRICLDVSHSKLHCNFSDESFYLFLEALAPYIAHLHLADSSGTSGEGLQIGDGEIDWVAFWKYVKSSKLTASFIPEIWQGHKNNGEGGWKALERLEGYYKIGYSDNN
jgi:sialic acid synthase SpsE/sugar phosphate isomerase/epimerase